MERKRLNFNKAAYEAHLAEYKDAEKTLNDYLDLLKALIKESYSKDKAAKKINNIDSKTAQFDLFMRSVDKHSLPQLKESVKSMVFDLLSENDKLNGFKVDKRKAFELIELPESKIDEIVNFISNNTLRGTDYGIDLKYFTIQNGKVTIVDGLEKELEEKHSVYATNERQLELYNAATRLKKEFESLHSKNAISLGFLNDVDFLRITTVHENRPPAIDINFDWIKTA